MSPAATEPTTGWLEGAEHVLPVRIYYEDTDFTGVVYHANYLRYFERGRSDFLRLIGVSHQSLLASSDPSAFTITRIEVDYRRAARVDDALVVRSIFASLKGPRLHFTQRILRGEDLIAEASVHAACIDLSGRARRPPPGLIEAVRKLAAP
jgi:acyl-CoA thioester hydrolase